MNWEVIQGDCLEVMPRLGVDRRRVAITSDNPYGMDNDADYSRFSGGVSDCRHTYEDIENDDVPFDPSYWLQFPFVTLWGYQFLASRLPLGSVLVWSKKPESNLGNVLSDCELGWEKGGCGVYQFSHRWDGFNRESERGERYHPNQKPIALMRWCIERQNLPVGTVIVDPYCGSGTTLLAAQQLGFDCIGIDSNAHYCEVARARIKRAQGIGCDIPKRVKTYAPTPLFEAVA